mmetsp:Transcript_18288/g.61458  ORF Transcript_18288/g.61458 Transcript_18288/m.61458 type:complete len:217 (-) Transcript_18288:489-1139(-)
MVDRQLLVADLHDHLGHLVHGDLLVRANVERLLVVGHHQPDDALDGVVNVAEGARLLPVAPHLELARRCDGLAAKCGGRLFAPSLPRAERAVDVVEAADARLHAKVGVIVHEQLLGHQLLEAVGVLQTACDTACSCCGWALCSFGAWGRARRVAGSSHKKIVMGRRRRRRRRSGKLVAARQEAGRSRGHWRWEVMRCGRCPHPDEPAAARATRRPL